MADEAENFDNSFNETFCAHLEYHLGNTFANSEREDIKGYWCDGVSWNPNFANQLSRKSVNNTRQIITTAWLGRNGQEEYQMTIKFGKSSLSRYARNSPMTDCIPSNESMEWIDIDTRNKKIEIRLK